MRRQVRELDWRICSRRQIESVVRFQVSRGTATGQHHARPASNRGLRTDPGGEGRWPPRSAGRWVRGWRPTGLPVAKATLLRLHRWLQRAAQRPSPQSSPRRAGGAERSIDSLALAVIRLVDAGRKVYRVSFTQRDYDFCQGPLRIPQWRPRRHPLAGRNGSRQAPIRSAGTLPYARDVPCLQRCHTAAGHRALR